MLADAGLQSVLLAFNGVDDKVYMTINGRPLYDFKRRAIDNLAEFNVEIIISPTIMRGINDDIKPLVDLCLQYAPHISQMRLRGAAAVGVYCDFIPLVMSELVNLLTPSLGRTLDQLVEELDLEACHHSVNQWIMECLFFSSGEKQGQLYHWTPGGYSYKEATQWDLFKKIKSDFGSAIPYSKIKESLTPMGFHFWFWPDRWNVDLEEIGMHGVCHLHDNRVSMNFYEAIIRAFEL